MINDGGKACRGANIPALFLAEALTNLHEY